jgi:hypothetical protein
MKSSMEYFWNDTDRVKPKYSEKNVLKYEVEYAILLEWYWQGETEVLGEKHVLVPVCSA